MSLRRETGKSSRLVIFLRWFTVSTAIIYLPGMWLLKLSPSFHEPYFTGWFFVGWLSVCAFYTLFMWIWMAAAQTKTRIMGFSFGISTHLPASIFGLAMVEVKQRGLRNSAVR